MSNIFVLKPDGRQHPVGAAQADAARHRARPAIELGFEVLTAEAALLQMELIKLQLKLACLPECSEKAGILEKTGIAERIVGEIRGMFVSKTSRAPDAP